MFLIYFLFFTELHLTVRQLCSLASANLPDCNLTASASHAKSGDVMPRHFRNDPGEILHVDKTTRRPVSVRQGATRLRYGTRRGS